MYITNIYALRYIFILKDWPKTLYRSITLYESFSKSTTRKDHIKYLTCSSNIIYITLFSRPSISSWIYTQAITQRSRSRIKTNVYQRKTTGLGFIASLKTIHMVFLDRSLCFDTQLLLEWLISPAGSRWLTSANCKLLLLFVRASIRF